MSEQTIHNVGIIMNGVTGRMGLNQHLRRSIYAIIKQGGVKLGPSEVIMPKPILVGRNRAKLEAISAECGGLPWTTDLDKALADPANSIYFDSQTTDRRAADVKKAIAAGKNIYCEKPISDSAGDRCSISCARRRRPASSTAWCRISSGCREC